MSSSSESEEDRHHHSSSSSSKKPASSSSSSSKKRHYSDDSDSDDHHHGSSKKSSSSKSKSSSSAKEKPAPAFTPNPSKEEFIAIMEAYRRPPTLKGGKAALGKKKPSDFNKAQLYRGFVVETREHGGNSPNVPLAIAMDHLTTYADYYTRIRDLEAKAKQDLTD